MSRENTNKVKQLKTGEYWFHTVVVGCGPAGLMLAHRMDEADTDKKVTPRIDVPRKKKQANEKRTICLIEARGHYFGHARRCSRRGRRPFRRYTCGAA